MTSEYIPAPRPASRHANAMEIKLPMMKRRLTPAMGPRISRSTYVPNSASGDAQGK